MEKPPLLVPSADEIAQMEQASAAANEVTNTVLSQKLELDEKKRTVQMLQKALVGLVNTHLFHATTGRLSCS